MLRYISCCVLLLLAACSSEQAYYAGKLWQGNQCSKQIDQQDYSNCMQRSGGDYDSYQKARNQN